VDEVFRALADPSRRRLLDSLNDRNGQSLRELCASLDMARTFDIEPLGELVKLTVVHDGFEPGSAILPGITEGWPRILSDLKTLLETSDTLRVG
jgi:DNA-binding transcriptional ArsR family regulator